MQWEYRIERWPQDGVDSNYLGVREQLEMMGKRGWELVCIASEYAYFKRPKAITVAALSAEEVVRLYGPAMANAVVDQPQDQK